LKSAKLSNSLFYFSSIIFIISFYCSFFAFIAFLPFLYFLDRKRAFELSFFSFFPFLAFIYIGIFKSLYVYYGLNIFLALILYLTIVFYHFIYIYIPVLLYKKSKMSIWTIPILITAFEYIKSTILYGMPIGNFYLLVYDIIPFIKPASYFGAYFITLSLILANTAIFLSIKKEKSAYIVIILLVSIMFVPYPQTINSFSKKISIVQGSIPQQEKWDVDLLDRNLHIYLNLSKNLTSDIVFWPESAYPYIFEEGKNSLEKLADNSPFALVTGVVRKTDNNYFNSIALISKNGIFYYNKQKLVPFAEFIPLRNIIGAFIPKEFDPGDFTKGLDGVILKYNNLRIGPMVCYEEAFSGISRRYKTKNANILAILTNDAWFNKTPTFYMLHRSSIFRAVENSIWLIRAANTGISEVITPKGKIFAKLKPNERKILNVNLHITETKKTFFDSYGHYFGIFLVIFSLTVVFAGKVNKK
jgi:apolipoprotein N-acyltransferase